MTHEEQSRLYENLETSIKELQVNIKEDKSDIEGVEEEIAELEEEVGQLEAEYEEAEQEEEEVSSELKSVQTKIGTKENDLNRAKDRLENLEAEAEGREELQDEIDETKAELDELKGRKESKYSELVDQFETAMDDIIEEFAPGFGTAFLDKKVDDNESYRFEINLARRGSDSDLDNLSEGERELVGIVTALAGYRTFDVDERVPCILLDGIGQLAAEHIERMIDYLEDSAEILVTTAYPEAGTFEGTTITPDEWDVITHEDALSA